VFADATWEREKQEPVLAIRCARNAFLNRRNGPTDGRTNGRTDTPSYRDAQAHLKINRNSEYVSPFHPKAKSETFPQTPSSGGKTIRGKNESYLAIARQKTDNNNDNT